MPLSLQKCPQALSLPSPALPHPTPEASGSCGHSGAVPPPEEEPSKALARDGTPQAPRPHRCLLHYLCPARPPPFPPRTPQAGELTSPAQRGPSGPGLSGTRRWAHQRPLVATGGLSQALDLVWLSRTSRQVGQAARHWLYGAASASCSDTCEQHLPTHAVHYSQRGRARHSQPG